MIDEAEFYFDLEAINERFVVVDLSKLQLRDDLNDMIDDLEEGIDDIETLFENNNLVTIPVDSVLNHLPAVKHIAKQVDKFGRTYLELEFD